MCPLTTNCIGEHSPCQTAAAATICFTCLLYNISLTILSPETKRDAIFNRVQQQQRYVRAAAATVAMKHCGVCPQCVRSQQTVSGNIAPSQTAAAAVATICFFLVVQSSTF